MHILAPPLAQARDLGELIAKPRGYHHRACAQPPAPGQAHGEPRPVEAVDADRPARQ
jgi:hypothetical protein